jgi:hypothetical protein
MVDVQERVSLLFDEDCDRCFSPAATRVSVGSLELYFCRQHYMLHEDALNQYDTEKC